MRSSGGSIRRRTWQSVANDLIAIAMDVGQGRHRTLVVAALGNMGKARDRVLPVLLGLLDEEAEKAIARLGSATDLVVARCGVVQRLP